MRKENFLKFFVIFWISLAGCTWGKQKPPEVKPETLEKIENPITIRALWSRKMEGAISELSIARNAQSVTVATQPDQDIEGSAKTFLLTRLTPAGKLEWKLPLHSPIRDLDSSADGSVSVVSNYEHEVVGRDSSGKELWSIEALCRPKVIQPLKKILCYHDDDSESDVGVDWFSWKGEKVSSFKIKQDILAFKVAEDQKHFVVGLAGGKVALFHSDQGDPIWETSVPGEIIDVAVSSEEHPKAVVLFQQVEHHEKIQKTAVLGPKGKVLAISTPSFHSIQVELSPQGESVFTYGNTSQGQNVGICPAPLYQEKWKRGGALSAVYSSSITVTSDFVILGYETEAIDQSKIHLLFFDHQGHLRADLPVPGDEASHLYGFKLAKESTFLVVATDDGRLNAYSLEK